MQHLDVEHHNTSPDGDGETIGWRFKVDNHRSVWCGEISQQQFESDLSDYEQDLAGGSDMGWFIVMYDDSKPRGKQSEIVARVLDNERGKMLAALIAAGWQASSR